MIDDPFFQFQVGDKVTPEDSWAENMFSTPRMRQGRVYCVSGVADTPRGPRVSFVGVREDRRSKQKAGGFWPVFAFRLLHRAQDRPERREAA